MPASFVPPPSTSRSSWWFHAEPLERSVGWYAAVHGGTRVLDYCLSDLTSYQNSE